MARPEKQEVAKAMGYELTDEMLDELARKYDAGTCGEIDSNVAACLSAFPALLRAARRVKGLEGELASWKQSYADMNEHRHEALDECDALKERASTAERERGELRAEVADLKEALAIADEELNQHHPDRNGM